MAWGNPAAGGGDSMCRCQCGFFGVSICLQITSKIARIFKFQNIHQITHNTIQHYTTSYNLQFHEILWVVWLWPSESLGSNQSPLPGETRYVYDQLQRRAVVMSCDVHVKRIAFESEYCSTIFWFICNSHRSCIIEKYTIYIRWLYNIYYIYWPSHAQTLRRHALNSWNMHGFVGPIACLLSQRV